MKLFSVFSSPVPTFALALILISGAPSAFAADERMFGISGNRGNNSDLYEIDPTNGTGTLIGSTGITNLHGLVCMPDTRLFAIGGNNGSAEGTVFVLNITTGAASSVGNSGINSPSDLTHIGNTLYSLNRSGNLHTVSTTDGSATFIGDTTSMRGAAADSAGNFFGVNFSDVLYSIDPNTGAGTALSTIGPLTFGTMKGMAFDLADTLFGVDHQRFSTTNSNLITIDPATRVATLVGSLPTAINQIAFCDLTDTDGDGLPDGLETLLGLDPNNAADAALDLDNDGLSNIDEFALGTDISNADSDGDGLSDGDEVNTHGTDPTDTDTDDDGIPDGTEIALGTDPLSSGALNAEVSGGDFPGLPEAAQDANGNYHVVWTADNATPDPEVYYALVAADGTVLINGTQISVESTEYDIMVDVDTDANGRAYIVWHYDNETFFAIVDPSLDDQDGSASTAGTIVVVAETSISTTYDHPRIAVDSAGNSHIVFEDDSNEIAYSKIDASGAVVINEQIIESSDGFHTGIGVAVDADDNVHIFWNDDQNDGVKYTKLANDGTVLIATTNVTSTSDDQKFFNPIADADGNLHVVYGDQTTAGSGDGGNIRYVKVDGSSGALLEEFDFTSTLDGLGDLDWYPRADLVGNLLYITWNGSGGNPGGGTVVGVVFDVASQSVVFAAEISNSSASSLSPSFSTVLMRPHAVGGDAFVFSTTDGTIKLVIPSLPTITPGISITTDAGFFLFFDTESQPELQAAESSSLPSGFRFPFGFFRFALGGLNPGQTARITVTLPTAMAADADFLKFNGNAWRSYPFGTGPGRSQLIFDVTDGGAGDNDGVVNGIVVDPAVIAEPNPPTGTGVSATGSGGGGCVISPNRSFDPLFPLLLLLAGVYLLRRRLTTRAR